MEEFIKSLRLGAVEFFGILMPGFICIFLFLVGVFAPLQAFVADVSGVTVDWEKIYFTNQLLLISALVIFSYVIGYILRLSSPDKLDAVSAKKVIGRERNIQKDGFEQDGWPYDPDRGRQEKYPYTRFREYLKRRGHTELTEKLVLWEPDEDAGGDPPPFSRRSKTWINRMKMETRIYCPVLSELVESKEGHVRLMAGTWAAMRFLGYPLAAAFGLVLCAGVKSANPDFVFPLAVLHHDYWIYLLIQVCLLTAMFCSMAQIEQLFHYRRVSELFHIVQAAYFAEQVEQERRREVDETAGQAQPEKKPGGRVRAGSTERNR